MRIVVFSDSHGSFDALYRALESQPHADMFLHLGDGYSELEDLCAVFPDKRILSVRGNCDFSCLAKSEDILTAAGKRIFFTHGHLYDVKRGTQRLIRRAKELSCDIALFGHTHIPVNAHEDGVHLRNPGSIGEPRGRQPSYAVIDLSPQGVEINILPLEKG